MPRPVVFVEIEPAQQLLDGASICKNLLNMLNVTLPETNSKFAPENRPNCPQRKFHLPTIHFQVLC